MSTVDDSDLSLDSIFTEPPRSEAPTPTLVSYTRDHPLKCAKRHDRSDSSDSVTDWEVIDIRLVGAHPLWGHHLWNAARSFATYLDSNVDLYHNRTVLELGAGGGLPGLVTAKNGASQVVLTDYPDVDLIENLEYNVRNNIPASDRKRVSVQGYMWGRPVKPLLDPLSVSLGSGGFDLIIMSDLIFNHSQHDALLRTCKLALAPVREQERSEGQLQCTSLDIIPSLLCFYTHHLPHHANRDLDFFVRARKIGWDCEEIVTQKFPPMFPDDLGDEEVRSTVHGWRLTQKTRLVED